MEMDYIKNSIEEELLCDKYYKKPNSEFKDYLNKIYIKPWGKEYMSYQNKNIGIWILKIDKNKQTSVHCHFKKDTILVCLSGCFKINLYNSYKILNTLQMIYIPKNTFHGIYSYTNNDILMEIEIYSYHVNYSDKNDLLRLRDVYVRDKDTYSLSANELEDNNKENMIFEEGNIYNLNKTEIRINKFDSIESFKKLNKYSLNFILSGSLFYDGLKVSDGSLIKYNDTMSLLSEHLIVLSIFNINLDNISKIIYNKEHLYDYMKIKKLKNVGMTCGCFDILHEGHIQNLKISKQLCDNFLVCLSSDEQITRIKGLTRPINKVEDRISMLLQYKFIDKIILYNETDDILESELDELMNIVNPDIWFKGEDYNIKDILKKHPSLKKIILHKLIEGKSTTTIIETIKNDIK